jgi:hypothetical protein
MELITILNRCHRFRVFVYEYATATEGYGPAAAFPGRQVTVG